jgi:hypothetical protein
MQQVESSKLKAASRKRGRFTVNALSDHYGKTLANWQSQISHSDDPILSLFFNWTPCDMIVYRLSMQEHVLMASRTILSHPQEYIPQLKHRSSYAWLSVASSQPKSRIRTMMKSNRGTKRDST